MQYQLSSKFLKAWQVECEAQPFERRGSWLVSWLQGGFLSIVRDDDFSLSAFRPFQSYVSRPEDIAIFLRSLLSQLTSIDHQLGYEMRDALASLYTRWNAKDPIECLCLQITLQTLGSLGIEEIERHLMCSAQQGVLYDAPPAVVSDLIQMCVCLGEKGRRLLHALSRKPQEPSRRAAWRSFIFILVDAQLPLCTNTVDPQNQEKAVFDLLTYYADDLKECSVALTACQMLTNKVLACLPQPLSANSRSMLWERYSDFLLLDGLVPRPRPAVNMLSSMRVTLNAKPKRQPTRVRNREAQTCLP